MKSQKIKFRNLPIMETKPHSIRVKPIELLYLIILGGGYVILQKNALTSIGVVMVMLGVFALILMPDRILAQISPKFLILYDARDRESCNLIYWDEIVSWSYEWRGGSDLLYVTLIDGSTVSADMYSKHSIAKYMNLYAANKETKNTRNAREK